MQNNIENRTSQRTNFKNVKNKIYTNVLKYMEMIPISLSNNYEESFQCLNKINEYLNEAKEDEFLQFCKKFPFLDFLSFSFENINNERGVIAFSCFSSALYSQKFKKSQLISSNKIKFYLSLLHSNNSDLIDSSISVLFILSSLDDELLYYLIENKIIDTLEILPQSPKLIQFIGLLCETPYDNIEKLCSLIIPYLNSENIECNKQAMIASKSLMDNSNENADIKQALFSCFHNNIHRYFCADKKSFFVCLFDSLNCFHDLPDSYGKPILDTIFRVKSNKINGKDKLIVSAISLFLFNKDKWIYSLSDYYVNRLFIGQGSKASFYENSSYEIQEVLFTGLFHYFRFNPSNSYSYDILQIFLERLNDDKMRFLSLKKIFNILENFFDEQMLMSKLRNEIQLFEELIISNDEKIQLEAAKIIKIIECAS